MNRSFVRLLETDVADDPRLMFGPFRLECAARELWRDGVPLHLEPKAFDVLVTLVQQCDRVVSQDELLKRHWGNERVCAHALPQCIWSLRKTLEDSASTPRYIKTLARRGYRFVAPLRTVEGAAYLRRWQANTSP